MWNECQLPVKDYFKVFVLINDRNSVVIKLGAFFLAEVYTFSFIFGELGSIFCSPFVYFIQA